eukprot:scaffold1421_cov293-Prasinococcus_capsulatus_cf.AAC.12
MREPPAHAAAPGVSVIMPVRNGEAHLEEALRSLAAAARRYAGAVQLCVHDDGSTDGSFRRVLPAMLPELHAAGVDVAVTKSAPTKIAAAAAAPAASGAATGAARGIGAARNAAVAGARHALLCFFDGDDVRRGARRAQSLPTCGVASRDNDSLTRAPARSLAGDASRKAPQASAAGARRPPRHRECCSCLLVVVVAAAAAAAAAAAPVVGGALSSLVLQRRLACSCCDSEASVAPASTGGLQLLAHPGGRDAALHGVAQLAQRRAAAAAAERGVHGALWPPQQRSGTSASSAPA